MISLLTIIMLFLLIDFLQKLELRTTLSISIILFDVTGFLVSYKGLAFLCLLEIHKNYQT